MRMVSTAKSALPLHAGHGLYIPLEDAEFIGVAEPAHLAACAVRGEDVPAAAVGAAGGGGRQRRARR